MYHALGKTCMLAITDLFTIKKVRWFVFDRILLELNKWMIYIGAYEKHTRRNEACHFSDQFVSKAINGFFVPLANGIRRLHWYGVPCRASHRAYISHSSVCYIDIRPEYQWFHKSCSSHQVKYIRHRQSWIRGDTKKVWIHQQVKLQVIQREWKDSRDTEVLVVKSSSRSLCLRRLHGSWIVRHDHIILSIQVH